MHGVTLCDPYLNALSVRYYNKGAIHKLPSFTQWQCPSVCLSGRLFASLSLVKSVSHSLCGST